MPTYEIVLIIWGVLNFIMTPLFFIFLAVDYEGSKITPNDLYAHTPLNKFGSWLLCIVVGVTVPLFYIVQALVFLCTKKG